MKKILIIFLSSAVIFFSACTKDNETVVIPEEPIVEAPCIGYLQFASPKLFFQRVDSVLEAVGFKAMAPMFLASYGYPEFPDFDPTTPLSVFLIDNEANPYQPNYFILTKLTPESNTAQMITGMGAQIQQLEDNWTLVSQIELPVDTIKNFNKLITIASTAPSQAIEGKVYMQPALKYRTQLMDNVRDGLAVQEWDNSEVDLEQIISKLLDEMDQVKHVSFTTEFSGQQIDYTVTLDSRTGTPLGNALQAAEERTITEQLFIPDDFAIQTIYNINQEAFTTYFSHLVEVFRPAFKESTAAKFDEISKTILSMLKASSGTYAGGQIRDNSFDSLFINKVNLSPDEAETEISKAITIANEMIEKMATETQTDAPTISFQSKVDSFEGTDIHQFTTNGMYDNLEAEDLLGTENTYFAVKDNYSIASYSIEMVKETINSIESGTLQNGTSMNLSLAPNEASHSVIDLVEYADLIMSLMGEVLDPKTKSIIEQLRTKDIPPVTTSLFIENSDAVAKVKLPIEKLIKELLPLTMQP